MGIHISFEARAARGRMGIHISFEARAARGRVGIHVPCQIVAVQLIFQRARARARSKWSRYSFLC